MREFTKSAFSFSWAMSLLPLQQMLNMLTPQEKGQEIHAATAAFGRITKAAEEELGDITRATFRAGDSMQRGLVDVTLGVFSGQGFNPSKWTKMVSDVVRQSAEAAQQTMKMTGNSSRRSAEPASEDGPESTGAKGKQAESTTTGWGPVK